MVKKSIKIKVCIFVMLGITLIFSACFSGCSQKTDITSYKINASLDEKNMTVNASMEVNYYNDSESELQEVKFKLYPNAYKEGQPSPITAADIQTVFPNGISYGRIDISNVRVNGQEVTTKGANGQIMSVPAKVKPYKNVTIKMNFCLTLPNAKHRLGFYEGNINLGNWYPIVCVYEDGEWDENTYYPLGDPFYSKIANYTVNFSFPQGYEFASTAKASIKDGETTASLKVKKARDFAICLTKNRIYSKNADGVLVKYFGKENESEFLDTAIDALKTFNNLFGKYPYDSLCVVKTPFYTGGMEYPGLVYVSDNLNESLTKEVIVHEIAHQWWYAVVGNNQVSEAWMDEGLAEYSTTLFYEYNSNYGVQKSKRVADAMTSYILYSDTHLSGGKADSCMNKNLTEFTDQLNYTYMTYVKGQLMFETLSNIIGSKTFIKGLKHYYKHNKFKVAKTDDIIASFEKVSKKELKSFFDSWLYGRVKMY